MVRPVSMMSSTISTSRFSIDTVRSAVIFTMPDDLEALPYEETPMNSHWSGAPTASPGPAAPGTAPGRSVAMAATPAKPWTVQVSSFRSRALAEELRTRLQAKGFDAYLVRVATDEGRVWHRVRVGGYATRAEAERVASELRAERNLNPVVTSRTR